MTNKNSIKKEIVLILIVGYLFICCNHKTEQIVNKSSKLFDNGKHIIVEKISEKTTSRGIITNYNYGSSHSFNYKFSITKENINWNGASGEPKNIIFCKDTIYIRYLKKKIVKIKYIDSINNKIKYNYHHEIQEIFQKHIDERYFFNLLGNDFWVDISSKKYNSFKKKCDNYQIPNDNELSLIN